MTTAAQLPAGTIVVGIDGSTHSERALNWAIAQAQLEKRPLTLLHGANVRGWDGLSPTEWTATSWSMRSRARPRRC